MTENEALKELNICIGSCVYFGCEAGAIYEAIIALNEIRKYRSIGTVEECRKAADKQKPKIPVVWGDGYDNDGNIIYDMYDCPNCGKSYEIEYDHYKHCPECGQAIDRSGLE